MSGTISLTNINDFHYLPDANKNGPDFFQITVSDSDGSTALVDRFNISIDAQRDNPILLSGAFKNVTLSNSDGVTSAGSTVFTIPYNSIVNGYLQDNDPSGNAFPNFEKISVYGVSPVVDGRTKEVYSSLDTTADLNEIINLPTSSGGTHIYTNVPTGISGNAITSLASGTSGVVAASTDPAGNMVLTFTTSDSGFNTPSGKFIEIFLWLQVLTIIMHRVMLLLKFDSKLHQERIKNLQEHGTEHYLQHFKDVIFTSIETS